MTPLTHSNNNSQYGNVNLGKILKKIDDKGMERTVENKKELTHDTKWVIGITILSTLFLSIIYIAQPFLSAGANRADSNNVTIVKNDALLGEFKKNQENFNIETKENFLKINEKIDKLATKDEIGSVKSELASAKSELKSDIGRVEAKLDLLLSNKK